VSAAIQRLKEYQFLLVELTKRDFKRKYKRTVLGMLWSVISPLLTLLVMRLVFTQFFGRAMEHYTTYLFAGNLVFSYFNEATTVGMNALVGNKDIFSKVNVPKYMFVFASNVSSFINFCLTFLVFFLFVALDGVPFTWMFLWLLFPIACLLLFNIGISAILSALCMFFADMQYLYKVFTMLLMYLSAIFYQVEVYPESVQRIFLANPIYVYIKFIRLVVLNQTLPSTEYFIMATGYAVIAFVLGMWIYHKNNQKFIFYV